MITYAQHLAFLSREVDRTWGALRALIAEQQGVQDAFTTGRACRAYTAQAEQDRYELGVQIGLMKLLMERLEGPRDQTKHQSDRPGAPAVDEKTEGGRAAIAG